MIFAYFFMKGANVSERHNLFKFRFTFCKVVPGTFSTPLVPSL